MDRLREGTGAPNAFEDASSQQPVTLGSLGQVATLVEAYGRMLGSLDPEAALPQVLDLARRFLAADAYAVWRYQAATDDWRISESAGLSDAFRDMPARMAVPRAVDAGFSYLAAPIPVEDALAGLTDPLLASRKPLYEAEGIRSLLIVPLQLAGRASATIVYYFRTPHRFAASETALAVAYSSLVSSALTAAELHSSERAARAEAEVARREAELLYRAGHMLSRTLDPDEIYDTVRDLIAQNMPCDSLIVSTFDPATEMIACAYAWVEGGRLDAREFPAVPLAPPGHGMQSQVIHSGKPLLISDVVERSKTNQTLYHVHADGTIADAPDPNQPRSHSMMLVPIILDRRVLGVVQIQCHQPDGYRDRHLRLLEAMVLQMAAAARNAFLYQQAHAEIEQRTSAEEALELHVREIQSLNDQLRRAMTETHHRVKNNLQIMAAMVDMQVLEGSDTVPTTELERLATHIRTLAVIHELLTDGAGHDGRADTISARDILQKLLPRLQHTGGNKEVRFRLDDALLTSRQGTSLALVANELVSNAVKYGESRVDVRFVAESGRAQLVVEDDGAGFGEAFDPALSANTGLELVENLSRWDLGGAARYENRTPEEGRGARVVVEFPATEATVLVRAEGNHGSGG
jgi:two-component sensor histidine kinase